MPSFPIAPIALAATLLGAASAHAAAVNFSGFANGYETVTLSLSAPNGPITEPVYAGGLSATLNGGPSFTTYCVDVYRSIYLGQTYTDYTVVRGTSHAFANARAYTDIGKLYAEGNAVNSAKAQAAFQIAIWEITYETASVYDLTSGSATFYGGTADSSGALALATTWLNGLSSVTRSPNSLWVLESTGHQDQVTTANVPEPASWALMSLGLLGIGFVTRRRTLQQR